MSQREFAQFLKSLPSLSPEQLELLRRRLDTQLACAAPPPGAADDDLELQRRLLEAGIVSEIKPPIRDFAPYLNRRAVAIQGEPLSETVIRERR